MIGWLIGLAVVLVLVTLAVAVYLLVIAPAAGLPPAGMLTVLGFPFFLFVLGVIRGG